LSGVSSDGWVGLPVGSPRGVVWRWESGKVGSESAAALVDHRNRGVLYLRRAERGGSESAVSSRSMSLRSCLPACAYTLGESMRGADQPQFVCRSSNPRTPWRSPPACNTAGDCTEAGSLQLLAPASRQHAPQAEDLWGPVNNLAPTASSRLPPAAQHATFHPTSIPLSRTSARACWVGCMARCPRPRRPRAARAAPGVRGVRQSQRAQGWGRAEAGPRVQRDSCSP
jgi:hypothetical protein